MISTEHLSELFVDVADTLVADFDVIEFLQHLITQAVTISGAQSAGLLLSDQQGRLQLIAASDSGVELLELYQLQNSEGPCLDCFATGRSVLNADLAHADDVWPTFAPQAIRLGYGSVHAFPMRWRETVIGAMNLFGSTDARFEESDVRIVQALADVATLGILQERNVSRAEALTEQLQGTLTSRAVIEQAKGAVAKLAGVGVEEAFDLLRARARATQTRLVDVAHQVLAGDHQAFLADQPTTK